jgi:AcrR family transcriptional regulator
MPGSRDTRQALLDAAAEEFARHGVDGARVQAVVRRSGVNERMIYHHFGSKEGLYRAVLADHWSDPDGGRQRALAAAGRLDPYPGLKAAFVALFEGFLARPLMLPLAMHESMSGWRALPPATLAQVPAEIRALYARGQREGLFRADCDFETLYLTVLGALTSLLVVAPRFADLRARSRERPGYLTQTAEKVIELVLAGASRPAERKRPTRRRK